VLLLAAVVVTSVAAYQAQDAVRSHRRTATRLVRDYGAFGAWTFAQYAAAALHEQAWRILGPIQHRYVHQDLRIPDASLLALYFGRSFDDPTARRHPPSSYFGYMLGSDTMKVVGAPLDGPVRQWVRDTIAVRSRGRSAIDDGETYLYRRIDGAPRLIAFALMPTIAGPIVYGFALDSVDVAALLADVIDQKTLLPPTLAPGVATRDLLGVSVRASDGVQLFGSGTWPRDPAIIAIDHLPAEQGGLEVRAAVRPTMASALIIGGLPRSRLPLISALLLLSLGLAGVAVVQIRRDQALARVRSDFVANVSHELRTPLAQIRLYLETLRLGRFVTDEQREWSLATIDRETQRLARWVENVLHFARAGAQAAPPARASVELSTEVAETVRAFEGIAAARRGRIELTLESGLRAMVDREGMRQVLLNLLDNAVKYGPPGQTVRVRLARAGEAVSIAVEDEGAGVPVAEREAVWEPFRRGASAHARAVGGSGIGLSVVRDIVARHGGRAWVEDVAAGGGARFVVLLPLERERDVIEPTAPEATPRARVAPATLG
jgi:signal transduction histidine kinase